MKSKIIIKITLIGVCTWGALLYILNKLRGGNNPPPILVVEADNVVVGYKKGIDFVPIEED